MRFVIQMVIILAIAFFMELFMPWWSVAVAAFIGGLLLPTRMNFLAGFLAIGLLWLMKALVTELSANSDFADRVARIFMLSNKTILLIVTFALIGLVGGFAAMTGSALRRRN